LWPLKQFLEPRSIFEPLFEGLRALTVGEADFAFHPGALLLRIEKLAQTFDAPAIGRPFKDGQCGGHQGSSG
jgi:hypothetical protein